MCSKGYGSCLVCVCLSVDDILMLQATMQLMSYISSSSVTSAQKYGDFPKTAVFELEKPAVSLTKLPCPIHQLVWCMRILCQPPTSPPIYHNHRVQGAITSAGKCCVQGDMVIKHEKMPNTSLQHIQPCFSKLPV